jgi:hypothetical protein
MAVSSQGFASSLGIDSANPVAKGFEFDSASLTKNATIIDSSGLRGSRSHRSERTRAGNYTIQGTIELTPSPEDLALLLPWVLGAAASGTTYALADSLVDRYVTIDKVAKVYTYAGVQVNKATFHGAEGQAMKLTLDLVGKSESEANAGSFPGVTYSNTAPFMFSDSVLSLVGAARDVKQWTVTIDNSLDTAFYNSVTATRITPRDRVVSFDCTNPFTATETDLYNQAVAGSAATLTLTNGGYSLSFAFAALQVPARGPSINGRQEIPLVLSGIARMSGGTKELVVTLDSTP